MITNSNETRVGKFPERNPFCGVATVNIVAVNPNKAELNKLGWNLKDDDKEPEYVITTVKDGVTKRNTKIRLMARLLDFEDKPVIPLDFFVSQDVVTNAEKTKCVIFDTFCRTAWATKEDVKNHSIPQYVNGPAQISSNYRMAHVGEVELTSFFHRYLSVTPWQHFDSATNTWVTENKPGEIMFDNWNALCAGNVSEVKAFLNMHPNNQLKVILGYKTTDDNKKYQTVITGAVKDACYIYSGASTVGGVFKGAEKAIEIYTQSHPQRSKSETYSASPVFVVREEPTKVEKKSYELEDNIPADDIFPGEMLHQNEQVDAPDGDLPF